MAVNSVSGNTLLESGIFPPCRAATTAPIALSGLQTVDGVALNAGDRVLVWQQADLTTNGIYAASTGNWVRTTDARSSTQFFNGMAVMIAKGGVTYSGALFQCTCTDDPVVVGTSLLSFATIGVIQLAGIITAASATAFVVGANGATNPAFQIDTSPVNAATGLLLKSAAAGSGVTLSALSSAANENFYIKAKGSGNVVFNGGGSTIFASASQSGGIFVGYPGVSSGDDSAVLVGRALAPASGLLNSHAYRDETQATENVTASQFSGYASFDSAVTISGSCTTPMNHVHGFQARMIYNATGHVAEFAGLTCQTNITNSGIVDAAYGVLVQSPNISGGGSIGTQYAYFANTLTGATNSYFLFQGSPGNPSVLNGNLYIGGLLNQISVEKVNIEFSGATQYGLICYDSYSTAGSTQAIGFYRNGSPVGGITTTLTATAYNTSSDERLKIFTGQYDPKVALDIIRADPVRTFEWKADGSAAIGWGAQSSYAISPDLAHRPADESRENWGIDQSKRTPYLWAAVAGLADRVDAIEKHLAA